MTDAQVGAIGTKIRLTLRDQDGNVVDLSGATTKRLDFQKPDRTSVSKTAAFHTDGTDGKIQYSTESGFLDLPGDWKVQAYVVITAGTFPSSVASFKVKPNVL